MTKQADSIFPACVDHVVVACEQFFSDIRVV